MLTRPCDQRGYVLLIVLIFLQILSSLSLHELLSLATSLRINKQNWLHQVNLLHATHALTHIEREVLNDNITCVIPIVAAEEIAAKPLDWWQRKACYRFSLIQPYYFVVEMWSDDACATIKKDINNQLLIAKYYRITLFMVLTDARAARLILQSTIAKPIDNYLSCTDKMHIVAPGRQMIRELF